MRLLTALAQTTFWFALWAAIPAALLYPVVRWMLIHTNHSERLLIQGYGIGVALLFLPTGFLVDCVYRRFVLKKRISN